MKLKIFGIVAFFVMIALAMWLFINNNPTGGIGWLYSALSSIYISFTYDE